MSLKGIIAAAATPLRADRSIDLDRLVAHCQRLVALGCDGINLLGTTGEATSFSVAQREEAMRAVVKAVPREKLMVGTGAASLGDAARLTALARELGFAGALLLPPFYYKGITDDGLQAYVEALIETVGPHGLRLYLYHYPQLSGVPYPIEVVARLVAKYPGQLLGLKDSSGDMSYSEAMARRCPGFDVFPSTEAAFGSPVVELFAGCISASANVTSSLVAGSRKVPAMLSEGVAIRNALAGVPLIPAVKWALADLTGDDTWRRLMPPLHPLNEGEVEKLQGALRDTRYEAVKPLFRR